MMCRLPEGLPSKIPVTHHPQGTGRQTAHQWGCANPPPPTASSPPPLPPGGLSLPAKLHSAPSPGKEPPGCSHTPLAGPTISDTYPPRPHSPIPPPPGSRLALWSSRGTFLLGSPALSQEAARDCMAEAASLSLASPRDSANGGVRRGEATPRVHRHTSRRLLQKVQKAEALPGNPPATKGQGGPQARAASDRLAPAASAQGSAPSSGRISSKATVKVASSSQHNSAPSEGPASPEWGPAGVCPAAGAVWDLVPRAGGPFQGLNPPQPLGGTQGPQEVSA